eukprot:s1454_g5.t1
MGEAGGPVEEVSTTLLEDLGPNEATPPEGAQDSSGKGFVNQNGLAKMAVDTVGADNPVVIELLMHLECGVVSRSDRSWRKTADLLQGDVMHCRGGASGKDRGTHGARWAGESLLLGLLQLCLESGRPFACELGKLGKINKERKRISPTRVGVGSFMDGAGGGHEICVLGGTVLQSFLRAFVRVSAMLIGQS